MFSWRDVGVLYVREMRAALRERTIVISSILMPIFLYPFILWVTYTGVAFVRGQTEGFVSRVIVQDWPAAHAALKRELEGHEGVEVVRADLRAEAILAKIKDGDLDAALVFQPPATEAASLAGNFRLRLIYDESKERSVAARKRVVAIVDRYREEWLAREARTLGIPAAQWQVMTVERTNVASSRQMGALILGLMLPLFFTIMVSMGCFYPAVDATAGERERNTWETLMTTAASRTSIVTAKYLYVLTMGWLAGVLNLTAMTLTIKPILAPLLGGRGSDLEFGIPMEALPLMAIAAVLLAAFVAAGMMIFAAFARTFKEGQAAITPFYMLLLLPVMFLQVPDLEFSIALALIPICNVAMMLREAIAGTFHGLQIAITIGASLAVIAACLKAAAFVLQFEDVMIGSFGGGMKGFIRDRVLKRRAGRAAAGG